jgi:hypothetical protein
MKSNTWINTSLGYWDNPDIWQGGVVPPYSSSDTIIINHAVAFTQNIVFDNGGYMLIDSAGGLCGHHNMTLKTGAKLLKYGILELDTLAIPGGNASCLGNGEVILTLYGIISNGGSFSVNGPALSVGPWFECMQPVFAFTLGLEEITKAQFKIFPNPANNEINIIFINETKSNTQFEIYDIIGNKVFEKKIDSKIKQATISISQLAPGVYWYKVKSGNEIIGVERLVVVR